MCDGAYLARRRGRSLIGICHDVCQCHELLSVTARTSTSLSHSRGFRPTVQLTIPINPPLHPLVSIHPSIYLPIHPFIRFISRLLALIVLPTPLRFASTSLRALRTNEPVSQRVNELLSTPTSDHLLHASMAQIRSNNNKKPL